MVRRTNLIPGRIPLWPMVGEIDPILRKSHMTVDVRGEADQERYIPIPRWTGLSPEAAGTWQTDISMVAGV